jgi:hypothetical protein|tara:strand:- start:1049 stop:1228 length:180 start_codon:yes stop_codon:yes gene_type:complete
MDWDLELKNNELQSMIHVYEEHIDVLEKENKSLQLQVEFLKEQLEYKTFGKPLSLGEEE